jgi:hypothetical protein
MKNVLNSVSNKEFEMSFHIPEKMPPEMGLEAFRRYLLLAEKYGPVEKKIIEIYGLDFLTDVKFWSLLFVRDREKEPGPHEIRNKFDRLRFAMENLYKILQLLDQESSETVLQKVVTSKKRVSFEPLTVVAIEDNGSSSPERLILILESIKGFYEVSAELLHLDTNSLSVVACDSGSDKAFDFLGLAKAIEMVKEIIIAFWNKLVFFREDKSGKQLELIAGSLPIIEKISQMRQNGSIEPEKAELLKRKVLDCIDKFSKSGSTIPEIEQYTVINPRQLMRPDQKFLVAHIESAEARVTNDTTKKKRRRTKKL